MKQQTATDPLDRPYGMHHRRAPGRGTFTVREFLALCVFYENKCLCCGEEGIALHADHIVPLSKGGNNTIDNCQPLCKYCNSKKRVKTIDFRPIEKRFKGGKSKKTKPQESAEKVLGFRSHLKQLMREKAVQDRMDITVAEVCRATGISNNTLRGMIANPPTNVTLSTMRPLCAYFRCQLSDIYEHIPDAPAKEAGENG